jgi:hypothetical protein
MIPTHSIIRIPIGNVPAKTDLHPSVGNSALHQTPLVIIIKTPLKNVHVQQEKHMLDVKIIVLVEKMQLQEYVQKNVAKQETAHQQMAVILA